ncbi:hypothetical protein PIB30_000124 [Stylosanthes scabra]|uniref:PGG domain-containing protein n=1 Tax=Stylosanthes scabra TaxID=79078 RepID=A0ABU6R198_9FABA|nr:hypothetical protein [Stylosanthes scabra]
MEITTTNNNRYERHVEQSNTNLAEKIDDVRNTLYMAVVALIATATYQAMITPPGGLWQDDSDQHEAGKSVLATKKQKLFLYFVIGNTIGFYFSLWSMIYILLESGMNYAILFCLYALSFTYGLNLATIEPDNSSKGLGWGIAFTFGMLTILGPFVSRKLWKAGKKTHQQSHQ